MSRTIWVLAEVDYDVHNMIGAYPSAEAAKAACPKKVLRWRDGGYSHHLQGKGLYWLGLCEPGYMQYAVEPVELHE